MITNHFKAGTFLSSAMAVVVPAVAVSGTNVDINAEYESAKPQHGVPDVQSIGAPSVFNAVVADDHWNAEKNWRFASLAKKEALESLSIEEQLELDRLTNLRRTEKYPRTADEILWQRRQQRLTHGLVEALEAYVSFHERSDTP